MQDAEDKLLKSATGWQKRPFSRCRRAGDEAALFLRRNERNFDKNTALVDAWERIVPPGLRPFCRLDRRVGNTLTILAVPGPHMHQVMMMQHELLEALRCCCPAAGIRKLRILPLNDETEDI